jgi:hypothetical protein
MLVRSMILSFANTPASLAGNPVCWHSCGRYLSVTLFAFWQGSCFNRFHIPIPES